MFVYALEVLPVAIHLLLISWYYGEHAMPSIYFQDIEETNMTYQGSFDLPPVALGEWLEI